MLPDPAVVADHPAYVPHVAEGLGEAALNELRCLSGEAPGSADVLGPNTALVHGIRTEPALVAAVARAGASLVWSPRSNLSLYGDTARVRTYLSLGVPVALGTDWSVSGSMNMLRELRCARDFADHRLDGALDAPTLLRMATHDAAMALGFGHELGSLRVGTLADVTVFDGAAREDHEEDHEAVVGAGVADVALVLRGGAPLYGDAHVIEALLGSPQPAGCEALSVCGRKRRLCLERDTGLTLSEVRQAIDPAAYPLFFCDTPEDEPSCTPMRPGEYDGRPSDEDRDGDGVADETDNCASVFNPAPPGAAGQGDADSDALGDACDPCPLDAANDCRPPDAADRDGDGVADTADNCPRAVNAEQLDTDRDGRGDACDRCRHDANTAEPCPRSIYDIKTGVVAEGARVVVRDALVTGVAAPLFALQVDPDHAEYRGVDHSGIFVYAPEVPSPAAGDRVRVQGVVNNFHGQIQIAGVVSLRVLSSGNPLPAPESATPNALSPGGDRQSALEGVLVRVSDVTVTEVQPAAGPGDSDPTHEFVVDGQLTVDDLFYRTDPFPTVDTAFSTITGVLRWAHQDSKLEPRSAADVILATP